MLNEYSINASRVVPCEKGEGVVLVYVNPSEDEKRFLVRDLLLDEHTLNSALDPDELSRLEFEPEHLAVIFKKPKNYSTEDEFLFKVNSMGLFLFRERLVIVIPDDIQLFNGKVFNNVRSLHDVLLKILYRTIFHYLDHLKAINLISESLEQKINASLENKYLLNLFSLEKSLVYYLNAINSNAVVIDRIRNHAERLALNTENRELLDDISIENTQCYRQAEIYSNILASMMDARVSIVSNNLNVLMKTLNIITIAIMVPTFVVSAFSMNVRIPMAGIHNAFYLVIGLALLSVIGFYLFWKWKKW
jgi:magnesium transporter